jgi:hypothetical protein
LNVKLVGASRNQKVKATPVYNDTKYPVLYSTL